MIIQLRAVTTGGTYFKNNICSQCYIVTVFEGGHFVLAHDLWESIAWVIFMVVLNLRWLLNFDGGSP